MLIVNGELSNNSYLTEDLVKLCFQTNQFSLFYRAKEERHHFFAVFRAKHSLALPAKSIAIRANYSVITEFSDLLTPFLLKLWSKQRKYRIIKYGSQEYWFGMDFMEEFENEKVGWCLLGGCGAGIGCCGGGRWAINVKAFSVIYLIE